MLYNEEDMRRLLRVMSDHQLLCTLGRVIRRAEKYFRMADIVQEMERRVEERKSPRDKTGLPD